MIGIIDYGMGNLMSLSNALKKINVDFSFIENANNKNNFTHLILPGVGAYPSAIDEIKKENLIFF